MKQLTGGVKTEECFPAGWNVAAKPCAYCKSAAALLFCRTHAGFMCMSCDAKLHAPAMKHERVWMCEVCEQAPAAVTCKADAAVLCFTCDRDIHSANPLARRHDRVPVAPFYDTAAATLSPIGCSADFTGYISPDPFPIITDKNPVDRLDDVKSADFFFSDDSDQFVSFDNYQIYSDSVVPVGIATVKPPPENRFEIDFTRSNITSYYYNNNNNNSSTTTTTASHSHSVSSSSIEVGIVPDGSAISETSYPFTRSTNYLASINEASEVGGMNREARVLRYKEKRKNRKFEKTIRYASRKAYAENRPRIKGRFAKRTESETDMDEIFSYGGGGTFLAEARYGVVPSF